MNLKPRHFYATFFITVIVLTAIYFLTIHYKPNSLSQNIVDFTFFALVIIIFRYFYIRIQKLSKKISINVQQKKVPTQTKDTTLNIDSINHNQKHNYISFERWRKNLSQYPLKPGDKISLWIKPGTSIIKAYHSQSINSDGYLGTFSDSELVRKYPPSKVTIRATVLSANVNRVIISRNLLTRKKRNLDGPSFGSFLNKLEKKSRVGIKIYSEFEMVEGFNGNTKVFLQTREYSRYQDYAHSSKSWKEFSDFFFLVNKDGECVSVRHCSNFENLNRMIRAWKMGYGFKMVYEGYSTSEARKFRCETFKL